MNDQSNQSVKLAQLKHAILRPPMDAPTAASRLLGAQLTSNPLGGII